MEPLRAPLAAAQKEMRSYTDALGRTVEIPVDPQRIVSTHDLDIARPPVEPGADAVGPHGRPRHDGSTYARSVGTIFDVDFDNPDVEHVGGFERMGFEAMMALEPDLVIAREGHDEEIRARLEAVAPTVFVRVSAEPFVTYEAIADVANRMDEDEDLRADHEALIERARRWLPDAEGQSCSKIQAEDGVLHAFASHGGLTQGLDEPGLEPSVFAQGMMGRVSPSGARRQARRACPSSTATGSWTPTASTPTTRPPGRSCRAPARSSPPVARAA